MRAAEAMLHPACARKALVSFLSPLHFLCVSLSLIMNLSLYI